METKTAIRILGALAQETRLAVFRLLVRAGSEGLSAGEIAGALSVPAPTLSFHLKELSHAGLIEAAREGRSIRYSLCAEGMREFLEFLTEDCCQGHAELCLPREARSWACVEEGEL
jgi:DNA-binding transcriptional ArsR family regulator